MCEQLSGSLFIHAGLRLVALHSFVAQPPYPSKAYNFIELVLLDLRADVRTNGRPLPFLDYTMIHVDDVHSTIGCSCHVDRSEQRVRGTYEFGLLCLVDVSKCCKSALHIGIDLSNDTRHRLTIKILSLNVIR